MLHTFLWSLECHGCGLPCADSALPNAAGQDRRPLAPPGCLPAGCRAGPSRGGRPRAEQALGAGATGALPCAVQQLTLACIVLIWHPCLHLQGGPHKAGCCAAMFAKLTLSAVWQGALQRKRSASVPRPTTPTGGLLASCPFVAADKCSVITSPNPLPNLSSWEADAFLAVPSAWASAQVHRDVCVPMQLPSL